MRITISIIFSAKFRNGAGLRTTQQAIENSMKNTILTVVGCALLVWVGAAHAQTGRYVDNGDGTITDKNTGLMWEKKTTGGGVHEVNN